MSGTEPYAGDTEPYPVEILVCGLCKQPWDDHQALAKSEWEDQQGWDYTGPTPSSVLVTAVHCVKLLLEANRGPRGNTGPQGATGLSG